MLNRIYSIIPSPQEITKLLANKVRSLRKQQKLSQVELAERSGVSLGSLKRFETTGKISLESLLKLVHLLDRLEDFMSILNPNEDFTEIEKLFTEQS